MEKPGREKEVRGKKRDGQQRKEKEKDGNGKNERIYPLENILFDTNIRSYAAKRKVAFYVEYASKACYNCAESIWRKDVKGNAR